MCPYASVVVFGAAALPDALELAGFKARSYTLIADERVSSCTQAPSSLFASRWIERRASKPDTRHHFFPVHQRICPRESPNKVH